MRVTPGSALGPHRNTAIADGTSPNGGEVTDRSDSGTDSDPTATNPDEPGDTGGSDDPVPVRFPQVDLTVDKTVAGTSVLGDGTMLVTWRLVVTNNGPGDDPGPITVTDELAARLSSVSAEGNGWVCGEQGRTVTCVRNAPLAAGDTAPAITLVTRSGLAEGETVTNNAEVSSTVSETRTDNNTDGAEASGQASTGTPGTPGTLPRTGAGIAGLLLAGLALLTGGHLLRRRSGASS